MLKFLADSLVLNKNKELNKLVGFDFNEETIPICDNLFICVDILDHIKTHGIDNAKNTITTKILQIINDTQKRMEEEKDLDTNIYLLFEGNLPFGKLMNERIENFKDDIYAKKLHSIQTTWKKGKSIQNNTTNSQDYNEILPRRRFWSSPGSPFWKQLLLEFQIRFKYNNKITILAKEDPIKAIKNIINDSENTTKSSRIITDDPMIYNYLLLEANEEHEYYLNNCRIDLLKLVINNWVAKLQKRKQTNLTRKYYHDVAVISILFGTKFTPKFLMISMNLQLIESIIKDYIKRSSESLINEKHMTNTNELYLLFNCLAKRENEYIIEKLSNNNSRILNIADNELTKETVSIYGYNMFDDKMGTSISFEDKGWEDRYYKNYAKMIYKEEINDCVDQFINTLKWQILHYSGLASKETYYPYTIAPLFSSIIQLEAYGLRPIYYGKIPNLSLEQKFYLSTPSLGYHLIPEKLRKDEKIGHYFPLECDMHTLGEKERKNCIPRLPLKFSDNLLSVLSKV